MNKLILHKMTRQTVSCSLKSAEYLHFFLFYSHIDNKKERYGPFLWMEFNYPEAVEPLQGDNLLLPLSPQEALSPGSPSTHLIDLRRMKGPPWTHPKVLNQGLMDWESSDLVGNCFQIDNTEL